MNLRAQTRTVLIQDRTKAWAEKAQVSLTLQDQGALDNREAPFRPSAEGGPWVLQASWEESGPGEARIRNQGGYRRDTHHPWSTTVQCCLAPVPHETEKS